MDTREDIPGEVALPPEWKDPTRILALLFETRRSVGISVLHPFPRRRLRFTDFNSYYMCLLHPINLRSIADDGDFFAANGELRMGTGPIY